MPNNEEKGFASAHINCLGMIYLIPYRNPYKIRKKQKLDLTHFIKK